jgi:hypothetical protein
MWGDAWQRRFGFCKVMISATTEGKDMERSHSMALPVSITMIVAGVWSSSGFGQEMANRDVAPNITGTGVAGHIAVWTNSTTLANSQLVQSGGNVGIGTTAPSSKLDVAGDINLSGSIRNQGGIVLQFPGSDNVALGLALQGNTTGSDNTAAGFAALLSNTTGVGNTAIGSNALESNSTGTYNTAVGNYAMFFGGAETSNNTAIGANALVYTVGSGNAALGEGALIGATTGNNNIAIGYGAGQAVTTTSNNIDIGNSGAVTDSGTIRIGTTGTQSSAFVAGIYNSNVSGAAVQVNSNGQLGIVSSSRRYKEDIQSMGDASDGLMQLRPVTFRYKKPYDDGSKPVQYGLIAEEVADVYPDLIARSSDGQVESVKYQLLDPMLLNELQKQHATITAQKEQIQQQESQIRSLGERLARVEAALGTPPATTGTR